MSLDHSSLPRLDGKALLTEGIPAVAPLLTLWAAGHTPALPHLRRIASETDPEHRWLIELVDWWAAAALGVGIDDSRWVIPNDTAFDPHSDVVRILSATSALHQEPLFRSIVGLETGTALAAEARGLLVYAAHGNLGTQSEPDAFNELVSPLREAFESWDSTVQDVPAPPTAREIETAARNARLELNSPRYNIMISRMEETWTAFERAADAELASSGWPVSVEVAEAVRGLRLSNVFTASVPDDDAETLLSWIDAHGPSATAEEQAEDEARSLVAALDAQWSSFDGRSRLRAISALRLTELVMEDRARSAMVAWSDHHDRLSAHLESIRDSLTTEMDEEHLDVLVALENGDLAQAEALLRSLTGKQETLGVRGRLVERRNQVLTAFERLDDPPVSLRMLADSLSGTPVDELTDTAVDLTNEAVRRAFEVQQTERAAQRAARLLELRDELDALELAGPVLASAKVLLQRAGKSTADPSEAVSDLEALSTFIDQQRELLQTSAEDAVALLGAELEDVIDPQAESELETARALLVSGEFTSASRSAHRALRGLRLRTAPVFEPELGEAALVERIITYIRARLNVSPQDIKRLHVALKTKPFVILAGLSGSGKSSIGRLYAEAVGATSLNDRFFREAVQPNWVDGSSTLGFYNPISREFEPGWLTDVIVRCLNAPDQPHFVLLDEMNLAPVEYYLADILSVMEDVQDNENSAVRLYSSGIQPGNRETYEATIAYPRNLFLIGTVNTDETTRTISQRVLDRASYVQLDTTVDDAHHRPRAVGAKAPPIQVRMRDWRSICATDTTAARWAHDSLVQIARELGAVNVGVGLRTHLGIERYIANSLGVLSPQESFDAALLQRVLPKVRGFKRKLESTLEALATVFEAEGALRCAHVTRWWLSDAVDADDYLDGGDQAIGLVLSGFVPTYDDSVPEPIRVDLEPSRVVSEPSRIVPEPSPGAAPVATGSPRPWNDDELRPILQELVDSGDFTDGSGHVIGPLLGSALRARVPGLGTKPRGLTLLVESMGFKMTHAPAPGGGVANAVVIPRPQPTPRGAQTPAALRDAVLESLASDSWRAALSATPRGADLTVLGSMIAAAGLDVRESGFSKLSIALRYALTGTDYCVSEPGGVGPLVVGLRSTATHPHADISDDDLRGRPGAELALQRAPRFDPVPRGLTETAMRMLMQERREWPYDELAGLGLGVEAGADDWKSTIRNLVSAGILERTERLGPPAVYRIAPDVYSTEFAAHRVATAMRERLETSSWVFQPATIDEVVSV